MVNCAYFIRESFQPTFPNWSTMNLKASMKKLEPSGLDLLDQMLVIFQQWQLEMGKKLKTAEYCVRYIPSL